LALCLSLFSKEKIRRNYALFSMLLFVTFSFLVFLQRPGWDPFQGRYFLTALLPIVPMVAILLPDLKFWKEVITIVIMLFCTLFFLETFLTNDSKPIITSQSIWDFQSNVILKLPSTNRLQYLIKDNLVSLFDQLVQSSIDRRTIYDNQYLDQVYFSDSNSFRNVGFIRNLIPNDSTLFLTINDPHLEYGLFGRNKTRDLIPVQSIDQISSGFYLTRSSVDIPTSKNVILLGSNGVYAVYQILKP